MSSVAMAQVATEEKIAAPAEASPLVAEVWPYKTPPHISPKLAFEQWRAQEPSVAARTIALNGLVIPAREHNTMVRVAGVFHPPVTGNYAFTIDSPKSSSPASNYEAELWIFDDNTSEWKLAQASGNPVKREARTHLKKGVPRRFEIWTRGKAAMSVAWQVREWDAKKKALGTTLARQTVPATAVVASRSIGNDGITNTPQFSWKQRHRVSLEKSTGPDSPWGDPDGDGLLNWQEQLCDADPHKDDCKGKTGLIQWEIWRNIPGKYVFDLRRASHFPLGSHETRYLQRLEIPIGNGDNYGSRLRGLLVAPADGDYSFVVSADDRAELWLGQDEKWQTKRLIAQSDKQAMNPYNNQQPATIKLKAGQKYYLEVLYKQAVSTDRCSILWKIPGTEKPQIITAKNIIAWKPCPTDANDDGLPEEWQRSTGLLAAIVAAEMCHCEADPDFDGATNRDEWLANTNPLDAADFPIGVGMLTCESWIGIPGHHINDLIKNSNFPARADAVTRVDNVDFRQEGENYAGRLRGFLTAPEDGKYSFSISGNNAASLLLGQSTNKFTKRLVANVEVGTNWRSFTGGQAVTLKRGEKYYIEVLYKRGVNSKNQGNQIDHTSIAWTRPNSKPSIIAPGFFSTYHQDPRDRDDDDLPDDWEKRFGFDSTDPVGNQGAWGDADGDGLANFREFQRGLNPSVVDVHGKTGLALWEVWDNMNDLISAHNDRGGLAPALLSDLRFPLKPTSSEWRNSLEAPRRQGVNFGARLRAYIVAPTTGDYVFSIACRDVGQLFLSPDASKFKRSSIASLKHGTNLRSWDNRMGQTSKTIRLEAGKRYYIEALYARGSYPHNDDYCSIGWKTPDAKEFKLIGYKNLIAFHRDPNDQDDDDLPDDWEKRYGLDATNPRDDHGTAGDPDFDGFTNAEELSLGTNPTNKDTDGDGIADYDEVHTYKTNPLVEDTIPPVELIRFPLESAKFDKPISWSYGRDGSLTSVNRRGSLSFEFDLDKPGFCVVEVNASSLSATSYNPAIPFLASVNGVILGRASATSKKLTFSWMTQWLPAGKHTVSIDNRNLRSGSSLSLHSVKLLRHQGEDKDGNGIIDWMEKTLLDSNRIESSTLASATSPACIEGVSRILQDVVITSADAEIEVHTGIASGWYANVSLDKEAATSVLVAFENSAIRQEVNIEWVATDLLTCPEKISVRVGDSLKVSTGSADEKTTSFISYNGEKVPSTLKDGCGIIEFMTAGEHKIILSPVDDASQVIREVTVRAYEADFGKTFDVATGVARKWVLPGVPHELALESDPSLLLQEIEGKSSQPRSVNVTSTATLAASPVVVARLDKAGPIVASTTVNSFVVAASTVTNNNAILRILPDGTRVIRAIYAIDGNIPDDLSIWIEMYVTDVVFSNGDTWHQLTAADFNEKGEATLDYYKAPGRGTPFICHWIRPYMDHQTEEQPAKSESGN